MYIYIYLFFFWGGGGLRLSKNIRVNSNSLLQVACNNSLCIHIKEIKDFVTLPKKKNKKELDC